MAMWEKVKHESPMAMEPAGLGLVHLPHTLDTRPSRDVDVSRTVADRQAATMSVRSELRAEALERAGHRCEWPKTCELPGPLETAHIMPSQMGGNPSRDTIDNVIMLCKQHHDWYDNREVMPTRELRLLMQGFVAARYGYGD